MIIISILHLKTLVCCATEMANVDLLLDKIRSLKVSQVAIFTENSQDKNDVGQISY